MSNKVVIVGGGFAGTSLAKRLERLLPDDADIELLSQENYVTFNPLLPEVVGASLLPGHVVAPLRQMLKRTSVRMVRVDEIDLEQKRVLYAGEGTGTIDYDHLVLACGQSANLAIVKGMARYALPLKTLGDALFLRNRIIVRLEQAEQQPNPEYRRWLTTFVVLGGGFSGVEVAGELVDFIRASRRYYPCLNDDQIRVILVHSGERLLPELSASLGEVTYYSMTKNGIDIRLKARAVRVDDRAVYLDSGEILSAGTVICTIGTAPNSLIADLPLPKQRGRIETAPDMSVPGYPNVWALGDCAAVVNARDNSICPPTAQFADRQGRQLAYNIAQAVAGRPTRAFSYKPAGQLSAIGHNRAVAEMFGLRISGFIAWLMWRGVYLLKIPTLGRKARLFLEWNWAMFFPPDIAHLGFNRTRRVQPERNASVAQSHRAA
ncbi:MAG: NAD(P)/FAD-dependent oxidoreductase [Woeseiaceae bacterium]|nr:NAD(P)/FAD-dependent oxidoreductase [Woeseiaceae bacterium]